MAFEIACRYRRANVTLPDNAAIHSIERVHVIRFGYRNDRCPAAWAVVDVERLRIDVADNCAVKVQIARKISGAALGVNAESM